MATRRSGRVVRFFGGRKYLLALRWRLADLFGREGTAPWDCGAGWVMDVRLTAGDVTVLEGVHWPGDSGQDDAAGNPVCWNEVLTYAVVRGA